MKQQTDWQAEFRSYIPLFSVVVLFAGGVFGTYKYFRERDRDYALRIDQDISLNLGQLLDFTKERGNQNARIAIALDNLLWLTSQAEEPERQTERVTASITTAIREDINLEDPREARFPALCLEHWPGYFDTFREEPDLQRLLPSRYNEALAKIARNTPDYFSQVQYDENRSFTAPESVNGKVQGSEYQHFIALVDGLWQHWPLIEDQTVQDEARIDFRLALGNSHLWDQLQNSNKVSIGAVRS